MKPPLPFAPVLLAGLLNILVTSRTETLVAKFMDFWFPKTKTHPQPGARAVARTVVRWYTWMGYGFGMSFIVAAVMRKIGWL